MTDWSRKVVLVTGAGGDIGRGISQRLAGKGAFVFANDRNIAGVEQTVVEIVRAGGRAESVAGDMAVVEDVQRVFDAIRASGRGLNVLVTQAGVVSLPEEMTVPSELSSKQWNELIAEDVTLAFGLYGVEEDFDSIIGDDLLSTYLCCEAAIPILKEQGGGHIVTMSSLGGGISSHFSPAYGTAKGGVVGLTRVLARELANDNILVNCVSQGFTDGGVWRTVKDIYPEVWERDWEVADEEEGERTVWATPVNALPLRRLGRVSEIAGLVEYLIAGEADYFTGQNFNLGGGVLIP